MYSAFSFAQVELSYQENKTPTYDEIILAYQKLANQNEDAHLIEGGLTDSKRKLQLFVLSNQPINSANDLEKAKKGKTVLLINNGIHAGESCGIDASIMFCQDVLKAGIPENVLIAIIPAYNVGGVLNRNCCTRANQDGPEEHGFRGNARNLDLNRDFIKADALNTFAFYHFFHLLKPHIFVDTHTSNGADYQYTMTLISTQKDKLNPVLSTLLKTSIEPYLYSEMKNQNWEMAPYVNVYGNNTPDKGYNSYLETPRYASGYTTLFNTIGFITETHMLKPYADRVESTRVFLNQINKYCELNSIAIQEAKRLALVEDAKLDSLDVAWTLNRKKSSPMDFNGFEYSFEKSAISGVERLKYHRDKPKTYSIEYFDDYVATESAQIPKYYVVPAAWQEVISRLQSNGVKMLVFKNDSAFNVESTYVTDFAFPNRPYEGHFPLTKLEVRTQMDQRTFFKGDYLINTQQESKRFIVSVLEAKAVDSYLKWNFYDEIFQQKEGFSAYVFEDSALELLESDKELKEKFEAWKTAFGDEPPSARAQLDFIYKNSQAYEKVHLRYPVAKIW